MVVSLIAARVSAEADVGVDRERYLYVIARERDLLDCPHRDAGDGDGVAGGELGCLCERGGIPGPTDVEGADQRDGGDHSRDGEYRQGAEPDLVEGLDGTSS